MSDTANAEKKAVRAAATETVRTACASAGLDLVVALNSSWYDSRVNREHALPDIGYNAAHTVLIGNTRAIWPAFLNWLLAEPGRLGSGHPLDTYVKETVTAACEQLPGRHLVRWAHRAEPQHIAFQQLAEAAGLAQRSLANMSVHPQYGPWFALRAVVVCDLPAAPEPPPMPPAACNRCTEACEPAFQWASQLSGDKPDRGTIAEHWRAWLDVRDACPVGRRYRYSEAQIRYHYTKNPAVLRAALAEERKKRAGG